MSGVDSQSSICKKPRIVFPVHPIIRCMSIYSFSSVFFAMSIQPGLELYNATDDAGASAGYGRFFGEVGFGIAIRSGTDNDSGSSNFTSLLITGRTGTDDVIGDGDPGQNTPVEIGIKYNIETLDHILRSEWAELSFETHKHHFAIKGGYRFNDEELRDHGYVGLEYGPLISGGYIPNTLFSNENPFYISPIIGGTLGISFEDGAAFFDGSSVYAGLNVVFAPR